MRKIWLILLFIPLILSGCAQQEQFDAQVVRDNYNTGGNLSFYYDNSSKTAYFGGENEVVQFYQADITKGWEEDGNRIGIQIICPKQIDEISSVEAKVDGEHLLGEQFVKSVSQSPTQILEFYPIIKNLDQKIEIKISFDSSTWHSFFLCLKPGTILMSQQNDE